MDVIYVDHNDKEIGSGSIVHALDNLIVVRIARIFIFNSQGYLLLQKRSETHGWLPGCWDNSASGHVDVGEDYEQAAVRELSEEVGINKARLTKAGKFYAEDTNANKLKKSFSMLFVGSHDGEVTIDEKEVAGYRWVEMNEILDEVKQKPNDFTPGFIKSLNFYLEKSAQELNHRKIKP